MIILIFLLLIVQMFILTSILKTCSDLENLLLEVEREQRRIDKSLWRRK